MPNPEFSLDDERITKLCQRNDPQGQEVLYNRYVNTMLRTCLRYMKEETEAEDIMIGGFVKVFSKIGLFEYRGNGSLEGWIKRIMVNECLMSLRRKKYDSVGLDNMHNMLDNGVKLDSNLYAEEIYTAVRMLPKGYRTVFNLYAIEGYSHKEIGEKLGINENTSKSQLSKARASLKKALIKIGFDD
ncbi:MAG: sigma-70 family RNA polymerase sigma factor [Cyclobacteriaceae bacterium]